MTFDDGAVIRRVTAEGLLLAGGGTREAFARYWVTAAVYPRLPARLRHLPKDYCLADLQRRSGPR